MRETLPTVLIIVLVFSFLGWIYLMFGRQTAHKFWYRWIYLRSAHWRRFRKIALASANWACQVHGCQNRHILDVHHLTYERLGKERLSDVLVVCRIHHKDIHAGKEIKLKAIYR